MATATKSTVAKSASNRARSVPDDEIKPRSTRRARVDDDNELTEVAEAASSYFAKMDKVGLTFISAGAALIDCALGGGWVCGRVANIVGDRSAGKTLLAIEACANFHMQFPKALIRYAESEAAFDEEYAEALGMPIDAVVFAKKPKAAKKKAKAKETEGERDVDAKKFADEDEVAATGDEPLRTIEDWYEDLKAFTATVKKTGRPGLYILDSLDALSDDAEQGREIDDGSYGTQKAKKLGELFRRIVADLESANVLLIVISQLRDKIGVTFGEKQTRTGGRALDFYASHIVWLAQLSKMKKTIGGVERTIGVEVRLNVKKNKVGLPFRVVDYPVLFGYGVDDLTANVEWLISAKREALLAQEPIGMSKAGYATRINAVRNRGGEDVREVRAALNKLVKREWEKVEQSFLPKSRKYG
jgi:RecA/RadA recombinase